MLTDIYDVAVVGGGISGSIAAIAAARNGAKVILIERYGFLGGTLTACGTGPMMTFHSGDIKVIRGITDELIERLKEKRLSLGHIFDTTGYTYSVTPFSAEGMKSELETMAIEASVDIMYHTTVFNVNLINNHIEKITAYTKNGKVDINAKVYIDASGDCDLVFLSDIGYTKGRKSDGKCQPVTMNFKVVGVDTEKIKEYILSHEEEFPRLEGNLANVTRAPRLSIGGFVKTLDAVRRDGRITFEREDILLFETDNSGEFIVNTTRVAGIDPTDPISLTKAEIIGRKQAWEVYRLLRDEIPGFENCEIEFTGPSIGVRSSRQLIGNYTLRGKDIVNCVNFPDAIACGGYPIDIHSPDGIDEGMYDPSKKSLKYGDIYTVPYRSLITNEVDNLIVVGRCISADFEAQAAIRVSPNAGAIGQAGGTAAAICAIENISVYSVDIDKLRDRLINDDMYLK